MQQLAVTDRERALVARYVTNPGSFMFAHAYLLTGPLDIAVLEKAVNDVVAQHDNLRSRFDFADGKVVRFLAPNLALSIEQLRLPTAPDDRAALIAASAEMVRQCREGAPGATAFPLIRVRVIVLATDLHILYYDVHHLIFDVWSHSVFVGALFEAYESRCAQRPYAPSRKPATIGDYLEYLNSEGTKQLRRRNLEFWKEHLRDYQPMLRYLNGRPRQPVSSWNTGTITAYGRHGPNANSVLSLARTMKVNPYAVYVAACALLALTSVGATDMIFESAVSLRTDPRHASLIGAMFGTIPFRCQWREDETFGELVGRIHQQYAVATARRDAAFEEWDAPITRPQGLLSPFSTFSLNYWPRPIGKTQFAGIDVWPFHVPLPNNTTIRCEYNVSIMEEAHGTHYRVRYHEHAYSAAEAWQRLRLLVALTLHVAVRPGATLRQLCDEVSEDVMKHYEQSYRLLNDDQILEYMSSSQFQQAPQRRSVGAT